MPNKLRSTKEQGISQQLITYAVRRDEASFARISTPPRCATAMTRLVVPKSNPSTDMLLKKYESDVDLQDGLLLCQAEFR